MASLCLSKLVTQRIAQLLGEGFALSPSPMAPSPLRRVHGRADRSRCRVEDFPICGHPDRTTVVYHRRMPRENRTQTPGSERQALEAFLDSQREAVIRKIEGLDDATARKAPTASAL